ncbi:N-acetyltransferase [Ramlibacter terrae]|uniref:N-acetyltransferase n=1 Tax=Ramlibacter terrae TaxID=2732511 RepID=A0ABX6P6F9_9BURK|nr:N-acetyltransferase [Ramlibacter terrae]
MRGNARKRARGWHDGGVKQEHQSTHDGAGVTHNTAASRYELTLDGKVVGHADYTLEGDAVRFTHTEVDPGHEGRGLASQLAQFALDDVRTRGLKALPQCRFIAQYIARHEKEYGGLVVR